MCHYFLDTQYELFPAGPIAGSFLHMIQYDHLGKPQKSFFSGPATKGLPPSSLVATFFHWIFLSSFFLGGPAF